MNDKIGRIEGIDFQIQIIFKSEYIKLLIPHFEKVGLDLNILDELINEYIKSGERVTYEYWFLEYGQRVINPTMNTKLKRDINHPTFNNLLRHALKEQLLSDPTLIALGQSQRKL
ncbi:MAG TPA: hypothetical protein VFE57_07665 [Cyclobacteriaceae bacterium]|jgi:hypothetical protein|nr:hypothetical protein [Cyclobacteriaceae bacterium]